MKFSLFVLAITCGAVIISAEEDALTEFVDGNRIFSAAVYKELLKVESRNFIVSPLSLETVLALTQEGARGETAVEMTKGLFLPSTKEKTQQAFKNFLPKLTKSEKNLKLLSANKIYAGEDVKVEPAFRSIATDVYSSEVDNIDFGQNVKAADIINEWVEDHTNKKIQKLVDSNSISQDTKLVLVNAMYFSGQWVLPFVKALTTKKKFFRSKEDTVEVDIMHQTDSFRYYENVSLNAKFLELPYKGGDISMLIVLPTEIDGLRRVEQNAEELFRPQPFKVVTVEVELPKFVINTKIQFIPILKNLGINMVFDERSDLSGISSSDKNLGISEVIQKAFINITESGTEAAAATSAHRNRISTSALNALRGIPVKFHANHPFIYAIRYHGLTLFAGRYVL